MERNLISYPVPFDTILGSLYLPVDLTQAEADRIKAMIDALVSPSPQAAQERE